MPDREYSPPFYSNDFENSDGSFDEEISQEEFDQKYARFDRSFSHDDIPPAVGFGSSVYGPRPGDVTVARTGPGAGRPLAYRTDSEPLSRFDGRSPEQIRAARGFRPLSDGLPVSLQSYQNTTQRSALVSFTRDREPSDEMIERTDSLSRAHDSNRGENEPVYRYDSSAPGGFDLTASLGRQSYADQHEVAFYKGVRDEYITHVTPYGLDDAGEPVQMGPTVPYVPSSAQGAPGSSQSDVAWAARLGSERHGGDRPSGAVENTGPGGHGSPADAQKKQLGRR